MGWNEDQQKLQDEQAASADLSAPLRQRVENQAMSNWRSDKTLTQSEAYKQAIKDKLVLEGYKDPVILQQTADLWVKMHKIPDQTYPQYQEEQKRKQLAGA